MIWKASIAALAATMIMKDNERSSNPVMAVAFVPPPASSKLFVTRDICRREAKRRCDRRLEFATTKMAMIRAGVTDDSDRDQEIIAFREEQKRSALVEALMGTTTDSTTPATTRSTALVSTQLVGRATLPTGDKNTSTISCILLAQGSRPSTFNYLESSSTDCLLVPLGSESPGALKLLSFAFQKKPVSKSVLITSLNPLLVNRDNGLFDNLPWSTWTVDPAMRNRDAANNLILAKFHLGKRDAYQRLLGKDWPGRSLAIGNLALRLQYALEVDKTEPPSNDDNEDGENDPTEASSFSTETMTSLAQRILELQLRELTMELAEWDYQLALARADSELATYRDVEELERRRQETVDQLQEGQEKLRQLARGSSGSISSQNTADQTASQQRTFESSSVASSVLGKIVQDVAQWSTNYGQNAAPYRGATGYAPLLDSRSQVDASYLPTYTSPYDVMKDIIEDQLNAQCIGVVLENTSFFQLTLGGAIVLQRKTATQSKTIMGETVSVRDEDEDFGNPGIRGGETLLVECFADEAVGMALACQLPIRIPNDIWEQATLLAKPYDALSSETNSNGVFDAIPLWHPVDVNLTMLKEGQARNTTTATASPLRIPKTTSSLWDSIWEGGEKRPSEGLFPTDNPIQSLTEYDELTNRDKARVLLSLSNFQGRLPRPRVVRQAEESAATSKLQSGGGGSPLDKLLLPLVDESVRRQYLIRDAERRGDRDLLQQLLETKSMRQTAKERAEAAQNEEEAEYWKAEADFYASLRADVTQDEGSYNRFLDRDEWYERNRQAQAKRVNKKLFGTLLDGIE